MLLKAFPSKQLPWSFSSVKKLLSYFLCQPIFAVNSWNTTKELFSTYGLDFPLFFGWLLHVCSCIGKDDTKNGECFVTILCENWWNTENSDCFSHQNTLPASYIQWWSREWETGVGRVKNGPAFLAGASKFGASRTPPIQVKMGVFLKEVVAVRSEGRDTLPWWCHPLL